MAVIQMMEEKSIIYSVTFFKDGWHFLQSLEDLVLSENVSNEYIRSSFFLNFPKRLEASRTRGGEEGEVNHQKIRIYYKSDA